MLLEELDKLEEDDDELEALGFPLAVELPGAALAILPIKRVPLSTTEATDNQDKRRDIRFTEYKKLI